MESRNFFKREDKEQKRICLITKCSCKDTMDCRRCNIPIAENIGRVSILLAGKYVNEREADNGTDKGKEQN